MCAPDDSQPFTLVPFADISRRETIFIFKYNSFRTFTMSQTFQQILELIAQNQLQISAHGYDELTDDNIVVRDALAGVIAAVVVEDYPPLSQRPLRIGLVKR